LFALLVPLLMLIALLLLLLLLLSLLLRLLWGLELARGQDFFLTMAW